MKIAVYGIALNETKHVDRFMDSTTGADGVWICDTGSTDDTMDRLRDRGAVVKSVSVDPWRFDTARNLSLDALPVDIDIAISLDLDEVLVPGWREIVEGHMKDGATVLRYPFVTGWEEDGSPKTSIWGFKIHNRHGYEWKYPIHEVLVPVDDAVHRPKLVAERLVEHYADPDQPARKARMAIYDRWMEEYEDDPRMVHFYAHELIKAERWEEAEIQCLRFLELTPGHLILGEDPQGYAGIRSKACRMLAMAAAGQGKTPDHICMWLIRSLAEAPWQREPWFHLGQFWRATACSAGGKTVPAAWALSWAHYNRADSIKHRELSDTIEEIAWGPVCENEMAEAWGALMKCVQEVNDGWDTHQDHGSGDHRCATHSTCGETGEVQAEACVGAFNIPGNQDGRVTERARAQGEA